MSHSVTAASLYTKMVVVPLNPDKFSAKGLSILKNELLKIAQEHNYDKLKPLIGICDEEGCWNSASCGWPTEDGGYRHTCSDHMIKND